tara:strand:- start:159 stop:647 length:489 start_codon:yes stop_codon:yes gene_type:complete
MFSYTDSNKFIIYSSCFSISLFLGTISLAAILSSDLLIGCLIGAINILMVCFLLLLSYTYRIDYTGITKKWDFRNKGYHVPINTVKKIIYRKRIAGGWSKRATLLIEYGRKKEQILLIKPRTEHYELIHLLTGWGIPLSYEVVFYYYIRQATQDEIDHLLSY